jgi:Domain of unknown function (DUF4351)
VGYGRTARITLVSLNRRVGDLSPQIAAQVQALSLAQLDALTEALLDFSDINDLIDWLVAHP